MTASEDQMDSATERDARRLIRALRHSQDRLASITEPLTPEQLREPSYHSWTIAQVLGHLGSGAELWQGRFTAALEGTDPPGQETFQPVWDAWNARSPEVQSRDGVAYNEREVQRLERLTDDELARMHLNVFGTERDAAGMVRMYLGEHAMHTWDIAVALDPTAQVGADAAPLLFDLLSVIAAYTGKPGDRRFRLHVHTTEPDHDFSVRVGDRVELTEWDGGTVDGKLRLPTEAFVRLVYGRLDGQHTPPLELTGPASMDDLRSIFPGV